MGHRLLLQGIFLTLGDTEVEPVSPELQADSLPLEPREALGECLVSSKCLVNVCSSSYEYLGDKAHDYNRVTCCPFPGARVIYHSLGILKNRLH